MPGGNSGGNSGGNEGENEDESTNITEPPQDPNEDSLTLRLREYKQLSMSDLDAITKELIRCAGEKNMSIYELLYNSENATLLAEIIKNNPNIGAELKDILLSDDEIISQMALKSLYKGENNDLLKIDNNNKKILLDYLNDIVKIKNTTINDVLLNSPDSIKECLKDFGSITESLNSDSVVTHYGADADRVSIAGHSYGAITAYKMIDENPNYFSSCVAISGWEDNVSSKSFGDMSVWAFHGKQDNKGYGRTTYPGAQQRVSEINAVGGKAQLTTFEDMGHSNTQNKTFDGEYMSPDGKMENAMDWAFRQKRNHSSVRMSASNK